jgi:hypothetical protein
MPIHYEPDDYTPSKPRQILNDRNLIIFSVLSIVIAAFIGNGIRQAKAAQDESQRESVATNTKQPSFKAQGEASTQIEQAQPVTPSQSVASEPDIGEIGTVTTGLPGCMSRDLFGKIMDFHQAGDSEAAGKALSAGFISGDCVQIDAGTSVYKIDKDVWWHFVQVRPKGEVGEYWTLEKIFQ